MKSQLLGLMILVAVAGCTTREKSTADTTEAKQWVVTSDSAGPLRIGMHADSALVAAGRPVATAKREACGYLDIGAPVKIMVENDVVVRFDVTDTSVATPEGARVGDPISRIEQLYSGRVRTQPHKYTNGKYLIVTSPRDTMHQLIFETDSARVTRYRGGILPAVGYVEGCG
jgi:hypothetical protein